MSAFIVSREHIGVLVEALFRYEILPDPPLMPTALGQQLWNENILSVAARYPHDLLEELPGPCNETYDYEHTRSQEQTAHTRNPWHVLCLAQGYSYQSCEHDAWDNSLACCLIEQLCATILRSLKLSLDQARQRPQWDEAPWSL